MKRLTPAERDRFESSDHGRLLAMEALPQDMQEQADRSFELLKASPRHPSLHLKKIGDLWSVRVAWRRCLHPSTASSERA